GGDTGAGCRVRAPRRQAPDPIRAGTSVGFPAVTARGSPPSVTSTARPAHQGVVHSPAWRAAPLRAAADDLPFSRVPDGSSRRRASAPPFTPNQRGPPPPPLHLSRRSPR